MPSLGCPRSHKRERPDCRLWFYGSLDPVLYVPAILGLWVQGTFVTHNSYTPCRGMKNRVNGQIWGALFPQSMASLWQIMISWQFDSNCMFHPYWVHGSKGYLVHIARIPALLWYQNRVYCLFWDAVIPTNEGIPAADYDFVAACTQYCMYKPYWVCGSKGYLVHTTHIPPAVEWKIAHMAKFGVPSLPQSRAFLWQIKILWRVGPLVSALWRAGLLASSECAVTRDRTSLDGSQGVLVTEVRSYPQYDGVSFGYG